MKQYFLKQQSGIEDSQNKLKSNISTMEAVSSCQPKKLILGKAQHNARKQ